MNSFPPDADAKLRTALKRCSPATLAAARAFRQSGDPADLPPLVCGIIERYLEPGLRPRLNPSDRELRLVEDLGLDSLTLMEIGMLAEDVLDIPLDHEDLRPLRTVGDVQQLMARAVADRVRPAAPPNAAGAPDSAYRGPTPGLGDSPPVGC
jgi:3-hydroxyacyl-[acyl-carrier-protein] dehydratase